MTHFLELQNVSKSYPTGSTRQKVLEGICFSVQKGNFVTIRGKSGSGKSTLLHLLGGLDQPDSGQIVFQGQILQNYSKDQWLQFRRFSVGFIFQFFHLFPRLTVLENILLPAQISGTANSKTLEHANFLLEVTQLGLHRNKPAQILSGGEMQRVAIARALINRPKLLLADEPTGNLDTVNSEIILSLLKKLHNLDQLTVVLVTHDPEVFKQGQTRYEILNGKTLERV